jgi:hypothetical protein
VRPPGANRRLLALDRLGWHNESRRQMTLQHGSIGS